MKPVLWICFCVLLAGIVRCQNLREVFLENRIYFVDADCYSRMTRARIVSEHPGTIVRHHRFENFPEGIDSHVTAPMDYLIAGFKTVLDGGLRLADPARTSVLRGQELDLAGAFISPLLGMMTCGFLGIWATRGSAIHGRGAVAFFFAISPIVVHGTAIGRPDHQSLLIFLLAIALGAESRLSQALTRRWALVSGVAWAVALWVSFYEPVVLLAAVTLAWLVCAPRKLLVAERRAWLAAFGLVTAIALGIEGWRVHPIDPALRDYFVNWSRTIGELGHVRAADLFQWLGWGIAAGPLLLGLAARTDRRAWPILGLLLFLLALTFWQLRWGYFLALFFVMTFPWQFAVLRRRWLVWTWAILSLWPIAQEWERRVFPAPPVLARLEQQRREAVLLREIAEKIRDDGQHAFLAPWWLSPAVAYWSGVPGVAGSSHEGMSGIVESARFYLAPTPREAVPILRRRKVRWIVADEPAREIENARAILGIPAPERPMAALMVEQPSAVAGFLQPVSGNDFFKLFYADDSRMP